MWMKQKDEPIRVAQIMGKLWAGGVEMVVFNYYRAIDKSKIQFDFYYDADSTVEPPQDLIDMGARFYKIPPYQKLPQYIRELKKHLKENQYLIVHSHLNTLSVFPLFVAWMCRVPVRVAHNHSVPSGKELKRDALKYFLRIFGRVFPTDYFACSEKAGRWMFGNRNYDAGKVVVIKNATDFERFRVGEELKKIAQSDSRIKIISYEKNRGLNHALNECLAVSQGKYIARQDDDDVSKPERLKKQVQFLDENREYAIVGTCADVFDNNGIWGEYTVPEKPQKGDFLWNSPFMHPTTMMRKAELLSGGGYREAKETRRCEDYDLFMNLYAKGYRGYNIQEKLYYYRIVRDEKNKHRPMKYRVDEMIVRFRGYKNMRMLLRGMPYVFKPVIIGLIPQSILKQIKQSRY